MIRKQIHITEQQEKKLQEIIESTGLKQSELFRRALDGFINSNPPGINNTWYAADPEIHSEWVNEIDRREKDIDEGRVEMIPGDEVLKKADKIARS